MFYFIYFSKKLWISIPITAGGKAWRQLHKNTASNIEQVLEATPHKQQLYGHLPPITKTIQVGRTRHTGHCWRSRGELISGPLHMAERKQGNQLEPTYSSSVRIRGCSPEDLPEVMNDRESWRKKVKDIRADDTMWWWGWWWFQYRIKNIYKLINVSYFYLILSIYQFKLY